MGEVIQKFSQLFRDFEKKEFLIPQRGDVHMEHRVVFDVASACCKWFWYPSVQSVLTYATLSETEFGLDPDTESHPNIFVDISSFLEHKITLLQIYKSELRAFLFPLSETSI